jgi:hypothetical protein
MSYWSGVIWFRKRCGCSADDDVTWYDSSFRDLLQSPTPAINGKARKKNEEMLPPE